MLFTLSHQLLINNLVQISESLGWNLCFGRKVVNFCGVSFAKFSLEETSFCWVQGWLQQAMYVLIILKYTSA